MKYKLLDNLGTADAIFCNKEFGASIDLSDIKNLKKGSVISLAGKAEEWLTRKYPGLLEVKSIQAIAEPAAIQATPPNPEAGTVEKATADLKNYKARQAKSQSDE